MKTQPELILPEHIVPRTKWEQLFEHLPPWPQQDRRRGRKPISRDALLKAMIFQRLTRRRFIKELVELLQLSPPMRAALGFGPYRDPPPVERFSAFLRTTPEEPFEEVRLELTKRLLSEGVLTGRKVGFDSCPIVSWVRENNLKTQLRHRRYDKDRPPKADPDARLGVRIHFPNPTGHSVDYFWGYRCHLLADLETELPLWLFVEPNDVHETKQAIPLLESAMTGYGLQYECVCADAA